MCLIAWNWQPGTAQPLLLAANRDEFYARPTAPLHWWGSADNWDECEQSEGRVAPDRRDILAGRDLLGGGTWLGVTRHGRMAALTNFRAPGDFRPDAPSRGALVADFLRGDLTAFAYLHHIQPNAGRFNPFNLLVFDGVHLAGFESRHRRVLEIPTGVGALSNADFGTPWPKLDALRQGMAAVNGATQEEQCQALWSLLADAREAPDDRLPTTGVALVRERTLSATFIQTTDYGTRASTLLRWGPQGLWMEERRFDHSGPIGAMQFTT
jgi:uncharacterized protein with NRDE domain